ncbi:MAG: FAD-dependent oxidoreductase [Chloroflexi bacterium]|nr:FAD-dependent oxidoreductase [Chloroflexota bacterium]
MDSNGADTDAKKLRNGSRVAVIGGGPAGSLFALYLCRYAGEKGIRPDVTIYQQRDFAESGPKGCKGCAGILSLSLLRNLAELGLTIPQGIIQSKIERYTVHSPYASISISNPEKGMHIVSIYRGNRPRASDHENPASFDGWLLQEAQRRGVLVENQSVSRVYLGREPAIEVAGRKVEYDLIVLASGVNTNPVRIAGLDYVRPKTQRMALCELSLGAAQVEPLLGNVAHVFLIPHSGLVFGTLVPKGPLINVSILSDRKHPASISDFLSHELVLAVLGQRHERACSCSSRAVVGSARNFYADRFVAVGDAAVTRLYKDGIGSALLTAREAAHTVAYHGLSRDDFEHYYRPFCRQIDRNNRWGRLLFSINEKVKDSRAFLLAQQRLIGDEQDNLRGPQPFTRAAWGMFTGSYSYRSIAWMTLNPASLARVFASLLLEGSRCLFQKRVASPRRLHIGNKKVLILGSGFGGAYVLRHLVPALNRNENVETTMVSDENFFLFSPLLHEVAMGRIETRHIAYPIRRLHWRDRFNFVQAAVQRIDLSAGKVTTTRGTLEFDYLVLALGSVTDMSGLESPGENVFTLKTLRDSMLIRNHVIGLFEQASSERDPEWQRQLLTFVVAGAGYTGVQLVAELRDFIYRHLARFYRTIDPNDVRIILVEARPKIVANLDVKLGAYVMNQLQQMGIQVRMGSRVTRVWEDCVEINGVERVPTKTLLWLAGVVANPRIAELNAERDSIGRVFVNEYLEVPDLPGVYAVGDCAHFEDPRTGRPIPPRAHIAVRQAKIVAHNILADIRGRDRKPYRYSGSPEIVSLGASKAVLRFHRLRVYGFLARLIWLVGYSSLVTGRYNRIRIIMDWLLSLVFGRDTTYLKLKM